MACPGASRPSWCPIARATRLAWALGARPRTAALVRGAGDLAALRLAGPVDLLVAALPVGPAPERFLGALRGGLGPGGLAVVRVGGGRVARPLLRCRLARLSAVSSSGRRLVAVRSLRCVLRPPGAAAMSPPSLGRLGEAFRAAGLVVREVWPLPAGGLEIAAERPS